MPEKEEEEGRGQSIQELGLVVSQKKVLLRV